MNSHRYLIGRLIAFLLFSIFHPKLQTRSVTAIMKSHISSHQRCRRFTVLAVIIATLLPTLRGFSATGQADVITLKNKQALHVVDQTGKPIDASAIPEDLRSRVEGIDFEGDSGLVLAKVKLPKDERDPSFASSLVGERWHGGLHYLNVGNGANADVICIRLGQKNGSCRLEVQKMQYRQIAILIPQIDPSGKIIWLGELAPQHYDLTEKVWHVVKGKVLTSDGQPLNKGEATIRLNGTPSRIKSPVIQGAFSFPDISPGQYLVEFLIDGYSAQTWWVTVNEAEPDISKEITAYPLRTFTLGISNGSSLRKINLTAGIPYHDEKFPLPDGKQVRLNQEGNQIAIYCPSYFIQVPNKMKGMASYNWSGDFAKGDVLQILNPRTKEVVYTLECLEVR
ncbi:MAG: carboxypeptidase-like regulatory domain-containing protein [Chthoniobacteraceae bacterium]